LKCEGTMEKLTQILYSRGFFRVHNSVLVNMNHIDRIFKLDVKMSNGEVLPISRRRKKLFQKVYMEYVFRREL